MISNSARILLCAAISFCGCEARAQIAGLCNTGQTKATASGCTGVLVSPQPNSFGTPHLDGNWKIAYPYPNTLPGDHSPCHLQGYVGTTIDALAPNWMANDVSTASEWMMPDSGGHYMPAGQYVYRTTFPVPATLPDGSIPSGVSISGRLASDNATYAIYLESPANSTNCALVSGQTFPVNPRGQGGTDFGQWWPFSFTNSAPLTPGAPANLYIVVGNGLKGGSPTGLRMEFSSASSFN